MWALAPGLRTWLAGAAWESLPEFLAKGLRNPSVTEGAKWGVGPQPAFPSSLQAGPWWTTLMSPQHRPVIKQLPAQRLY